MDEKSLVPAVAADRDALAAMLADAFFADPVFAWMWPDEAERRVHLPRLFALNFDLDLPVARTLKAPDNRAVSFWRPPGQSAASTLDYLMRPLQTIQAFGFAIGRVTAVADAIKAHLPTDRPFWHVHFVGVAPALQRQGWGSAMMKAGEAFTGDADIYLETARPENVQFYSARGYRTTGEWQIPGGPTMWSMLKSPG